MYLDSINRHALQQNSRHWALSFSFGRALQVMPNTPMLTYHMHHTWPCLHSFSSALFSAVMPLGHAVL